MRSFTAICHTAMRRYRRADPPAPDHYLISVERQFDAVRNQRIILLMKLVFMEAPPFTRMLAGYLTDEAYRQLQAALLENPELGDVIPGTGGFRKVRWQE